MDYITLGTRGSELALTQTQMTTALLVAALPGLEVRREVIKTSGDLRPEVRLQDFAAGDEPVVDKGIFTKELEEALKAGTIHAAVHSLKDVPTVLAEGYRIAAVLRRAAVEEVLISKSPGGLEGLRRGAVVATSSLRRACQLKALRPDVTVVEIRGNVPTRIRKTAGNAQVDGLMLAKAGLDRLGLFAEVSVWEGVEMSMTEIPATVILPAASQGIVGIEVYGEVGGLAEVLGTINDAETWAQAVAERRFLELLQAGCRTPVGVHTVLRGGVLEMRALVFPDDGGVPRRAEASGALREPEAVAAALYAALG